MFFPCVISIVCAVLACLVAAETLFLVTIHTGFAGSLDAAGRSIHTHQRAMRDHCTFLVGVYGNAIHHPTFRGCTTLSSQRTQTAGVPAACQLPQQPNEMLAAVPSKSLLLCVQMRPRATTMHPDCRKAWGEVCARCQLQSCTLSLMKAPACSTMTRSRWQAQGTMYGRWPLQS